jgi:deoxyinosine 3'endonuclease (endonuclease V)
MVFTVLGVAMLSAVLKSQTAIAVSVSIIQTFIALRRLNSDWNRVIQRVEIVENRQLSTEEKVNKLLVAIEDKSSLKSGIFFENQIFDAYVFIRGVLPYAPTHLFCKEFDCVIGQLY